MPENSGNQSQEPSPWPVYGQSDPREPARPDQNPWPVYGQGQPGQNQSPYGQPAYGKTPYGQPGPSQQAPNQPPPDQHAPGQPPYGPAPYGPSPYGPPPQSSAPPNQGPHSVPPGQGPAYVYPPSLPSRTGPILTIVGGVVMMLIIAPIVLITLILSGVGIGNIVDNSMNASNGGTVVVDETGSIGVIASGQAATCVISKEGAADTEMRWELDGTLLVARGLTPGEYTISCEGVVASDPLVILDGRTLETMVPSAFTAFAWASVVGVSGFVVLIVGIVWLIKRNRARQDMIWGGANR